jgi:hypothetical protein
VALVMAGAAELRAGPPGGRVLSAQPLPQGSFTISTRTDDAYWLEHPYYGTFRVAGDGSEVACAPNDLPDWLWQRFLVAQPLPLASLLHGYEPLHASAVALEGRALLLMGTSGAGKSSVALHLVARGASFLADDVTSLELTDGVVIAHRGASLASVDSRELESLPPEGGPGWRFLGDIEGESRIVIEDVSGGALPVGGVYVLTRTADARSIEIAPPASGAARVLLGGTFNAYLRDPARLERQLDIAARLAETVAVRHVRVPIDTDAGAAADAILESQRPR